MRPCCNEIWQEMRHPKTGKYLIGSLNISLGDQKFVIYPPITRTPKKHPKKVKYGHLRTYNFNSLCSQERLNKFKKFVMNQLIRVGKKQSILSFSSGFKKRLVIHKDNTDIFNKHKHDEADKHLKSLWAREKKDVVDASDDSSIDDNIESTKPHQEDAVPYIDPGALSDSYSDESGRESFAYNEAEALKLLQATSIV